MLLYKYLFAPGLGFEPKLEDPESPVLPLDDPGNLIFNFQFSIFIKFSMKQFSNLINSFRN